MARDGSKSERRRRENDHHRSKDTAARINTANSHRRIPKDSKLSKSSEDTVRDGSVTPVPNTTHIPRDLVSAKDLSELKYSFCERAGGYLIDGILTTAQLRELLVRSHERRQQSAKGAATKASEGLDKYVLYENLDFEHDVYQMCRQANVPVDIVTKIVAEHQLSQLRKARNRQRSESSNDTNFDLITQLARITITAPSSKRDEDTAHSSDVIGSESSVSDVHDDSARKESLRSSRDQSSSSSEESSTSEAEDSSTIDMDRPQYRGRRTRMDITTIDEDHTVDPRRVNPKTSANKRHHPPPQVPVSSNFPSTTSRIEEQALSRIQRDNTRHQDLLLLKTLEILQDSLWLSQDQRGSGYLTHAQVLKDWKEQENLFVAREAQRVEETKRIKQEALESEKFSPQDVQWIREQVRKEIEAKYYLVHKPETV